MVRIPVDIHLQDDEDKCGQACAQMITRALAAQLKQQSAFVSSKKTIWSSGSTPGQLADMLNQFGRKGALKYKAFAEEDVDVAIARLKACVNRVGDRYPGVALIHNGDHWEVVHGFTEPTDTANSIHLRNPLPRRDGLSPPLIAPHADGDQCNLENVSSPGGAPEDEAMTVPEWKADFFGPCLFATPARYHNRFVVVVPDVPLPERRDKPKPERRTKVSTLLDGLRLTQAAFEGLQRSGLLAEPGWTDALTGVRSDIAQPFLSVQRINRPGSYVLAILMNQIGGGCLVGVDAESGGLLFARLNPPQRIVRSLTQPIDRVVSAVDPHGHNARVVWAPARNTFYSPYFPLVEFIDSAGQTKYLRLFDGKLLSTCGIRSHDDRRLVQKQSVLASGITAARSRLRRSRQRLLRAVQPDSRARSRARAADNYVNRQVGNKHFLVLRGGTRLGLSRTWRSRMQRLFRTPSIQK